MDSGKLNSSFGSLFYAPTSLVKTNPQLATLMDNLHNVNLRYQGRRDRHDRSYRRMLSFVRKQMIVDGLSKSELGAKWNLNKITKEADKLEREIELQVLNVQNNVPGAKDRLSRALKTENRFYANGEGKVFNDFLKTIEKHYLN